MYREHYVFFFISKFFCGLSLCIQGTYPNRCCSLRHLAVYPCVYREHSVPLLGDLVPAGLSLCIQGTLNQRRFSSPPGRFIPVYTGNINVFFCFICHISVYPCVYREHAVLIKQPHNSIRFIPVYTGNIIAGEIQQNGKSVYPCVYREHWNSSTFYEVFLGLSLCIQGTLV